MQLYLVQHGEAKPKEQDTSRPLTDQGKVAVERMAALASRMGVDVAEIWHSDKLRAIQTAQEIRRTLGAPCKEVAGLAPNDDIHAIEKQLASFDDHLMIVGHLPFLSRLVSSLLLRDETSPLVEFRMGGMVRLDRDEKERWSLSWAIPPEAAA